MAKTKSEPKTTGTSTSRTPFKHWVLDSELGRLAGISSSPAATASTPCDFPTKERPFLVVDLCAGDGCVNDQHKSSPQIISHHLGLMHNAGVHARGVLIEKSVNTFDMLSSQECCNKPYLQLLNANARDYVIPESSEKQPIFIHADPNHIDDWPVTKNLIDSLSETTTMLCTLGCNVGGLKRKTLAERLVWFSHVKSIVHNMPMYHDALLIEMEGDASQWAYLLRLPIKWTGKTTEKIKKEGSAFSKYSLNVVSWRRTEREFKKMCIRLFKTKKERGLV